MARNVRDPARERMWRDRVAAWAASGLSIRSFCDRHQLTETTFQYWRRELRVRDEAAAPSSLAPPRFVPVTIRPSAEPAAVRPVASVVSVEVRCPSGHVVILSSCDSTSLSNLFAALASLASEVRPC